MLPHVIDALSVIAGGAALAAIFVVGFGRSDARRRLRKAETLESCTSPVPVREPPGF